MPRRSASGGDLHQGSEVSSISLGEVSGPSPTLTPSASPELQECAAQETKEWPGACSRQRFPAQCCKEVVKGSLEDLLVAVRAGGGSRPRPLACSQGLWDPEVPVWGLRPLCPEHSPLPLVPLPTFPDPTRQWSASFDLAPGCGWQDLRVYRAQPGWPCQGPRDQESPRSYLLHATPAVAAGLRLLIVVWEMFRNQPFNENKRN